MRVLFKTENEKENKMRKKSGKIFVKLERELLTCDNFRRMTPAAKVLYGYFKLEAGMQLKDKLHEGEFVFPYRRAKQYTGFSDPTVVSGIRQLIKFGFIIKTTPGGLLGAGGIPSKYHLSLKWQNSSSIIKQKQTIRQKKQEKAMRYSSYTWRQKTSEPVN